MGRKYGYAFGSQRSFSPVNQNFAGRHGGFDERIVQRGATGPLEDRQTCEPNRRTTTTDPMARGECESRVSQRERSNYLLPWKWSLRLMSRRDSGSDKGRQVLLERRLRPRSPVLQGVNFWNPRGQLASRIDEKIL